MNKHDPDPMWSDRPATPSEKVAMQRWVAFLWIVNFFFGAFLVVFGLFFDGGPGPAILGVVLTVTGAFLAFGMPSRANRKQ